MKLERPFITTDGRVFSASEGPAARKHQRILDAVSALATRLKDELGMEDNVAANAATLLSADVDLLLALMGKARRGSKDDDATQDEPAGDAHLQTDAFPGADPAVDAPTNVEA